MGHGQPLCERCAGPHGVPRCEGQQQIGGHYLEEQSWYVDEGMGHGYFLGGLAEGYLAIDLKFRIAVYPFSKFFNNVNIIL